VANGVEVRGERVRVYFTYQGEKCREPVPGKATKENIAYAERMVSMINHEIAAGTFDYGRHFPDSKRLKSNTLNHYLDLFLQIKGRTTADETIRGYKAKIETHIRPKFGRRQTDSIGYLEIEEWIADDLQAKASKTIKDTVAILRAVYKLYRKDHPGALDPTDGITVALPDDDEPDPFTREEIDLILAADPKEREQELNLIQFMIWTGPRVSEVLPFAWEDVVDLEKGLIHFRRSKVRGNYKATKTKRANRIIELVRPAREALKRQYAITGKLPPEVVEVKQRDNRTIKKETLRFVFMNSNTERPHVSDFTIRDRFFKTHLKRAGVRERGTNQCRHTYISQMLTAGMPAEWIAKQAGTSVTMIRKHYGKWIDDDATDMVALAESRLRL
jgi:integrase